jgi:hypothetical protein
VVQERYQSCKRETMKADGTITELRDRLSNCEREQKGTQEQLVNARLQFEKCREEATVLGRDAQHTQEKLGETALHGAVLQTWVIVLGGTGLILLLLLGFLALYSRVARSIAEQQAAVANERALAAIQEMAANKKG